jgi:hypothetical protein
MGTPRTLTLDEAGLLGLRSETKYTEQRLLARPDLAARAAPFTALLTRIAAATEGQLTRWDAEDAAQIRLDDLDDDLDDIVPEVSATLLRHLSGKDHPQYVAVFGTDTVSSIQRLGPESQRARMATWPALLRPMGPDLAALADRLDALFAAARTAVDAQTAAGGERASYRAGALNTLVDDLNRARQECYGGLVTLASTTGKPKGWAERFFRKQTKKKKPAEG